MRFDFLPQFCDAKYVSDQISQVPTEQTGKKEERIDELDVIGGLLLRLFQKVINSLKKRNNSQK